MEYFVKMYMKILEEYRKNIVYSCLPLHFYAKDEYIQLGMTKQTDIKCSLDKNDGIKGFVAKLSVKEFGEYFFNIMNKLGELALRIFFVYDIYKDEKKKMQIIGEDDEAMTNIISHFETIVMEYGMYMISFANLRNITRDEYI